MLEELFYEHIIKLVFIHRGTISLRLHFMAKFSFLLLKNHGGNDVVAICGNQKTVQKKFHYWPGKRIVRWKHFVHAYAIL